MAKKPFMKGRAVDGRGRHTSVVLELDTTVINKGAMSDPLLAFRPDGTVTFVDQNDIMGMDMSAVLETPTTTKGDLIVRDKDKDVRLPVGDDGQVLVADVADTEGMVWTNDAPKVCAGSISAETAEAQIVGTNCHKIVHGTYTVRAGGSLTVPAGSKLVVLSG
jgi:hypothetical protein